MVLLLLWRYFALADGETSLESLAHMISCIYV